MAPQQLCLSWMHIAIHHFLISVTQIATKPLKKLQQIPYILIWKIDRHAILYQCIFKSKNFEKKLSLIFGGAYRSTCITIANNVATGPNHLLKQRVLRFLKRRCPLLFSYVFWGEMSNYNSKINFLKSSPFLIPFEVLHF